MSAEATGRPLVVAVTGTSTSVGKTWVTAALLAALRERGEVVAARKPLQSFAPGETTDAEVLARASGEPLEAVTPPAWSYAVAMAPPIAGDILGRSVPSTSEVLAWLEHSLEALELLGGDRGPARSVVAVELVGGVRSPCCADADSAGVVHRLGADLAVIVADAGLGVINAVRLAAPTLAPLETVAYLNRYDASSQLHERNRAVLESDGFVLVTSIDELASLIGSLLRAPVRPLLRGSTEHARRRH